MERAIQTKGFLDLWGGHGCRGYSFLWEIRHYWEGGIEFKEYDDPVELFPQLAYMPGMNS